MTAHPFHGTTRNGKLVLDQQRGYDAFLSAQKDGARFTQTIQPFRRARTNKQNGWLWCADGPYAVLAPELTRMSIELVKQGILKEPQFFDVDAVHDLMKSKFLKRGTNDLYVIRSTTELTTEEFSEYLEQISHWAAGLGIYVAFPTDTELLSYMEKTR